MFAYAQLIIAAFLFSVQFVFQRQFTKSEGETLRTSFLFSLLTSVVRVAFLLLLGGFRVEALSPTVLLLTLLQSADSILFIFMSAKAFRYADMSLYSLLSMLGGMILPFLYGILFCHEGLGRIKGICFVLIAVAVLLGVEKSKGKGALGCYVGVFLANGMSGVLATMNREAVEGVDGNSYLIYAGLWTVIGSLAVLLRSREQEKKKDGKAKPLFVSPRSAILSGTVYSLSCSFGNLLLMIALMTLPASVQYPFITGGTIAFSAAISLLRKEKIKRRSLIAAFVAIAASALLVLA